MEQKEKPYIVEVIERSVWNPDYPEEESCECGHTYYRHFDT